VVWFRERSDAEYTSSVQSRRFVNNVDHITENGGDILEDIQVGYS